MTKSLLVVDDNETSKEFVRLFFEGKAISVLTATNGKEALEILQKTKVDLVISDLKMPEMKGDALYAELKTLNIDIPFYLLTGFTDHSSVEILKSMGIAGVIEKPFIKDKLEEIYQNHFQ
jgi:CheY-like chemotaxis protein